MILKKFKKENWPKNRFKKFKQLFKIMQIHINLYGNIFMNAVIMESVLKNKIKINKRGRMRNWLHVSLSLHAPMG